jgi:hypothetical protein
MRDVKAALHPERSVCQYQKCLLDGVPNLGFVGTLIATENFARVIKALALSDRATMDTLIREGEQYCAMTWLTVQKVRASKLC